MMKKIIFVMMIITMLTNSVFAVTRDVSNMPELKYTADDDFSTLWDKSYWVVQDTMVGCTLDDVPTPTSCGTYCEYTVLSNTIRVVVFPPDEDGTSIGNQKTLTLSGTGTDCSFSGNYGEAPDNPSSIQSIASSGSFDLPSCCPNESDLYPSCDGITWSELDIYITAWASVALTCDHMITWEQLDEQITAWALQ